MTGVTGSRLYQGEMEFVAKAAKMTRPELATWLKALTRQQFDSLYKRLAGSRRPVPTTFTGTPKEWEDGWIEAYNAMVRVFNDKRTYNALKDFPDDPNDPTRVRAKLQPSDYPAFVDMVARHFSVGSELMPWLANLTFHDFQALKAYLKENAPSAKKPADARLTDFQWNAAAVFAYNTMSAFERKPELVSRLYTNSLGDEAEAAKLTNEQLTERFDEVGLHLTRLKADSKTPKPVRDQLGNEHGLLAKRLTARGLKAEAAPVVARPKSPPYDMTPLVGSQYYKGEVDFIAEAAKMRKSELLARLRSLSRKQFDSFFRRVDRGQIEPPKEFKGTKAEWDDAWRKVQNAMVDIIRDKAAYAALVDFPDDPSDPTRPKTRLRPEEFPAFVHLAARNFFDAQQLRDYLKSLNWHDYRALQRYLNSEAAVELPADIPLDKYQWAQARTLVADNMKALESNYPLFVSQLHANALGVPELASRYTTPELEERLNFVNNALAELRTGRRPNAELKAHYEKEHGLLLKAMGNRAPAETPSGPGDPEAWIALYDRDRAQFDAQVRANPARAKELMRYVEARLAKLDPKAKDTPDVRKRLLRPYWAVRRHYPDFSRDSLAAYTPAIQRDDTFRGQLSGTPPSFEHMTGSDFSLNEVAFIDAAFGPGSPPHAGYFDGNGPARELWRNKHLTEADRKRIRDWLVGLNVKALENLRQRLSHAYTATGWPVPDGFDGKRWNDGRLAQIVDLIEDLQADAKLHSQMYQRAFDDPAQAKLFDYRELENRRAALLEAYAENEKELAKLPDGNSKKRDELLATRNQLLAELKSLQKILKPTPVVSLDNGLDYVMLLRTDPKRFQEEIAKLTKEQRQDLARELYDSRGGARALLPHRDPKEYLDERYEDSLVAATDLINLTLPKADQVHAGFDEFDLRLRRLDRMKERYDGIRRACQTPSTSPMETYLAASAAIDRVAPETDRNEHRLEMKRLLDRIPPVYTDEDMPKPPKERPVTHEELKEFAVFASGLSNRQLERLYRRYQERVEAIRREGSRTYDPERHRRELAEAETRVAVLSGVFSSRGNPTFSALLPELERDPRASVAKIPASATSEFADFLLFRSLHAESLEPFGCPDQTAKTLRRARVELLAGVAGSTDAEKDTARLLWLGFSDEQLRHYVWGMRLAAPKPEPGKPAEAALPEFLASLERMRAIMASHNRAGALGSKDLDRPIEVIAQMLYDRFDEMFAELADAIKNGRTQQIEELRKLYGKTPILQLIAGIAVANDQEKLLPPQIVAAMQKLMKDRVHEFNTMSILLNPQPRTRVFAFQHKDGSKHIFLPDDRNGHIRLMTIEKYQADVQAAIQEFQSVLKDFHEKLPDKENGGDRLWEGFVRAWFNDNYKTQAHKDLDAIEKRMFAAMNRAREELYVAPETMAQIRKAASEAFDRQAKLAQDAVTQAEWIALGIIAAPAVAVAAPSVAIAGVTARFILPPLVGGAFGAFTNAAGQIAAIEDAKRKGETPPEFNWNSFWKDTGKSAAFATLAVNVPGSQYLIPAAGTVVAANSFGNAHVHYRNGDIFQGTVDTVTGASSLFAVYKLGAGRRAGSPPPVNTSPPPVAAAPPKAAPVQAGVGGGGRAPASTGGAPPATGGTSGPATPSVPAPKPGSHVGRTARWAWAKRSVIAGTGVSLAVIGKSKHEKYNTPEPGESMTEEGAPARLDVRKSQIIPPPPDTHLDALRSLGGLPKLGAMFGLPFLIDLANLGADDYVIFSGSDNNFAKQYLDEGVPDTFRNATHLKGTPAFTALEKLWSKNRQQKAKVTSISPIDAGGALGADDRAVAFTDTVALSPLTSLTEKPEDGSPPPKAKLIVDVDGAFDRATKDMALGDTKPIDLLKKYLASLHDEGTLYLSSSWLDNRQIEYRGKTIPVREWIREKRLPLEVNEVITAPGGPRLLQIRIAPPYRGDAKRAEVLESVEVDR